MEPTDIDCTKISKNKEIDAYLNKFRSAIAESVQERRTFHYNFNFSCFEVAFCSQAYKVKKSNVYRIFIIIYEKTKDGRTLVQPPNDHRFQSFEWASKFDRAFCAEFILKKNGPEIVETFYQILKNVFKTDVMIAFS